MEGTPPKRDRPTPRVALVGAVLGGLLTFLGTLTVGNAPYPVLGYGFLSLPLFLLPYGLPRREAAVSFVAGLVLGVAVDLRAESLFAFVGIGAVFVRGIQFLLILRLKERHGFLTPVLLALLFGTVAALLTGAATYGGEGLQPAYAVLDAVYVLPAYLAVRLVTSSRARSEVVFGLVAVGGGTLGIFFAASTFLLVLPLGVALGLLTLAGVLVWRGGAKPAGSARPAVMALASLIAAIVLVGAFALSGPAAGDAARATLYPLYPDSLAASQWIQTSSAAGCRQGNLVGGGTQANGLYGHERLRVLSTCVTVRGVIKALEPTSGPAVDGDFSFDLALDPGYGGLLSLGSYVFLSGLMHVEIVPSDQPTVLANVTLTPGSHVQVTGPWVLDTDHGWFSEIHPAWSVVLLSP